MSRKDEVFNELVNQQPTDIKEWIIEINKFLTDGGCSSKLDAKNTFTFTHKKSKKMVCKININKSGCTVRPNTNNDKFSLDFPEIMLKEMRGGRGCGVCAENNPDFIHCKHGGPFKMDYKNENFERCRYFGFNFDISSAEVRGVLAKWVKQEFLFLQNQANNDN